MNPAHKALRERTRAAHERVDAVFARYDLADRGGYAAMLRAHLDALLPLEARLTRAQAAGGALLADWPERRRLPALLADLDSLGARPAALAPVDPRAAASDAEAAGVLYVLEGSRIGGRFLARQVPADWPRAYLDSDQPPGKWRELLAKLDPILYDSGELDTAVGAAREVFDLFEAAGRKWQTKE